VGCKENNADGRWTKELKVYINNVGCKDVILDKEAADALGFILTTWDVKA
jgi:hypothetical protein